MKLGLLFRISSIYLLLLGLGTLISPAAMMAGALDPASLVLVDTLRGFGGAMLSIAMIDWLARDAEPSKARNAIVLGHTVGFAFATVFGVLAWLHGYPVFGCALILLTFTLIGYVIGLQKPEKEHNNGG